MTLTPCKYHPGELVVEGDERDLLLAEAVGAQRFNRRWSLTPARARKFQLLCRWGFEAVHVNDRWLFRRGGSKLITLDHAMLFVEVMGAPLVEPVA
jgi:hypothetical protein